MTHESTLDILTIGGWIQGVIYPGSFEELRTVLVDGDPDNEVTFTQRALGNETKIVLRIDAVIARRLVKERTIGIRPDSRKDAQTKTQEVLPPHPRGRSLPAKGNIPQTGSVNDEVDTDGN